MPSWPRPGGIRWTGSTTIARPAAPALHRLGVKAVVSPVALAMYVFDGDPPMKYDPLILAGCIALTAFWLIIAGCVYHVTH